MTSTGAAFGELGAPAGLRARLAALPRGPVEGWLTVGALALLLASLAWSIDDPGWIGGRGERTDYLAPIAMLAMAVGLVGAKLGWHRWPTHVIGAVLAAIVLPLVAGDLLLGDAVSGFGPAALAARYTAAAESAYAAWHDIAILDRPFTSQWGHYVIAIGGLVWGTAQYAAYAVFGHRRPLDAVVAVGIVLLGNMALTSRDQLHLMVFASLGGLLLLTRSHAFEERTTWLRRRIGDPAAVTSLYLRGGSVFIAAAVLGSLTLTATASSSPLQGLWADVPQRLVDVSQWLQKYLPFGGASVGGGLIGFGSTATITGTWTSPGGTAFSADLPAGEREPFYWRAATYSTFELTGWTWGDTESADRAELVDILADSPEDPAVLTGRRSVTAHVYPDRYSSALILSPATIKWASVPTRVRFTQDSHWFEGVELRDGVDEYSVTALVPLIGDEGGGLTENRLRAAGQDYPAAIRALYLKVPDGALGPDALRLKDEILRLAGTTNPYDLMALTTTMLRDSGRFSYDEDVSDLDCSAISSVECFARYRRGYCQYFASTMAMLLRSMGVPTRLVQGFLPGERDASGHEVVFNRGSHAWVEVYFPGIGWVDRDPTSGRSQEAVLPSGVPVPVTPKPSFSIVTPGAGEADDRFSRRPGLPGGGGSAGTVGPGPFILLGLVLVVVMATLVVAAWRRGPRHPMEPDVAWRGVLGIARRLGFGPRPAQTVFEYAGALGDEVPQVRPELQTVARAKVEVAYGRHVLGEDRLRAIALASRRLRLGLLRLAFRRRRRRRGPRPI